MTNDHKADNRVLAFFQIGPTEFIPDDVGRQVVIRQNSYNGMPSHLTYEWYNVGDIGRDILPFKVDLVANLLRNTLQHEADPEVHVAEHRQQASQLIQNISVVPPVKGWGAIREALI